MKQSTLLVCCALLPALVGCAKEPWKTYKSREVALTLDPAVATGSQRLDFQVKGRDRKKITDAVKNGDTVTLHVQRGEHVGNPGGLQTWNGMFAYTYPDESGGDAWFYQNLNAFEVSDRRAVFERGGKECPPVGSQRLEDVLSAIAIGNLTLDARRDCAKRKPDGVMKIRSWVTVERGPKAPR